MRVRRTDDRSSEHVILHAPTVLEKKTGRFAKRNRIYLPTCIPIQELIQLLNRCAGGVNSNGAKFMARQSSGQKKTVHRVMHEYKHGELKAGRGRRGKVKNPKQAIAIALHEAGASNQESPSENKRNLARTKRRERAGGTEAPRRKASAPKSSSAGKKSARKTSGRKTTRRKTASRNTTRRSSGRESTARKATARKSTARKATARKSTARKSTTRKSTTRKSSARQSTESKRRSPSRSTSRPSRRKSTGRSTAKRGRTAARTRHPSQTRSKGARSRK
jgi:hypothetical protein